MFAPPAMKAGGQADSDVLKSIRHIDHVTYVAAEDHERSFIDRWLSLGFHEHVRLRSYKYPATHIALVSGSTPEYPWATMTGLSVSEEDRSPVNEFVRRYGEGMQHVAYNVHPKSDFEEVYAEMKKLGWNFMTGVLTYKNADKSQLRQFFAAPTLPYGPFTEFIQRLPGPDGNAFGGFDSMNIDDLYTGYDDFSKHLDRKK